MDDEWPEAGLNNAWTRYDQGRVQESYLLTRSRYWLRSIPTESGISPQSFSIELVNVEFTPRLPNSTRLPIGIKLISRPCCNRMFNFWPRKGTVPVTLPKPELANSNSRFCASDPFVHPACRCHWPSCCCCCYCIAITVISQHVVSHCVVSHCVVVTVTSNVMGLAQKILK